MEIDLFQTLEQRNNPDEVTAEGPFICTREDAWLGPGYYFWDSHVQLAHWWGQRAYHGNYIICQALGTKDEKFIDLLDGRQRIEFANLCQRVVETMDKSPDEVLVPHIIMFLLKMPGVDFNSIRAFPLSRGQIAMDNPIRYKFSSKTPEYLDLIPAIQVCLYEKQALSLSQYRIVYPDEYFQWVIA